MKESVIGRSVEHVKGKFLIRVTCFVILTIIYSILYFNLVDIRPFTSRLLLFLSDSVADFVILFSEINIQGIPIQKSAELLCLQGNCQLVILPLGAFLPYLVAITGLFVLISKKYFLKLLIASGTLLFLFVRAVIITWISLHFRGEAHYILLLLLQNMVYFPMAVICYSLLVKVDLLRPLYQIFEKRFQERFMLSSYMMIGLILVLPTLPRIAFRYVDVNILESIIHWNLYLSSWVTETFTSYKPLINDRYMFIGHNWISLEGPCIGTGVMTIVVILILAFKSPLINKILYSVLFVVSFMLMNAIRLAFLLVYIHEKMGVQNLDKASLHNNVTYAMYLFSFVAFAFYVLKFSEIKLNRK